MKLINAIKAFSGPAGQLPALHRVPKRQNFCRQVRPVVTLVEVHCLIAARPCAKSSTEQTPDVAVRRRTEPRGNSLGLHRDPLEPARWRRALNVAIQCPHVLSIEVESGSIVKAQVSGDVTQVAGTGRRRPSSHVSESREPCALKLSRPTEPDEISKEQVSVSAGLVQIAGTGFAVRSVPPI